MKLIEMKNQNTDLKLVLPRDPVCYFNWRSFEFGKTTFDKKLIELGLLLSKGFNLKNCIDDYKLGREAFQISTLPQTLIFYIMYLRYNDYYQFVGEILEKQSEAKLIQLLIDELKLLYNPIENELNCLFMSDDTLIDLAEGSREYLIDLITSSDMTKKILTGEDIKKSIILAKKNSEHGKNLI
ncbi:MAG: hypothetical protein WCJ61_12310 [Paludibacter sp.]